MNFGAPLTITPRPFDPERGREVADCFPDCTAEARALLAGAAGCSPYLAGLIEKEADWLRSASDDITLAVKDQMSALSELAPDQLHGGLRQAKRRVALATALGDLGGAWALEKVTGMLTQLADAACSAALRAAVAQQVARGKLPGATVDDLDDAAGMVVLAMGKMGAGELNYSSDIDLICLFDEMRYEAGDFAAARSAFVRATRAMCAMLNEIKGDGYVFRTDLRLRPDPAVTPVCIAMGAAEHYYESLGRTWERAAYIKARPATGDIEAGVRFLASLRPFVWRRYLDFAAIQDAHDMRLAIRAHKGLGGPITLPGHNMKLGRGGIREIEFFTQTRQLIAGGRDADLRTPQTLAGLKILAEKNWIPEDVAAALAEHYRIHRTVEHRLQMVQDAQTHTLPKTEDGFARLAAMMDRDVGDLKTELTTRLEAVHDLTEGFFAPAQTGMEPAQNEIDSDTLDRWMRYPALRSARSRAVFERVKPDLLARLAQTAEPDEAVLAFDGFLAGLPAGVQLFSLLEANPSLTDLIIDVSGTSRALGHYLSQNAQVFDAVIGGDFFTPWPGQAGLEAALRHVVEIENDYEAQLDATRRWSKEWRFRVGVHFLRGLISAEDASAQYSDLARAVVSVVWPVATDQFSRKYGPPPGRGAVVVGMGSLGAGRLNAASDLDLIVIYDPLKQDASTGKKPIATRAYYARLTQSLITALSAPMSQGKLYEVDMRLRPSGNQGPVATSWSSFQSYQTEEAWTWEHLALTRAAVIAGPEALAQDVSAFRTDLLCTRREPEAVLGAVAEMCARIRAAKAPLGELDVKTGPGRLQEIELMAQAGALMSGELSADTRAGLAGAVKAGVLTEEDMHTLAEAADLFFALNMALRLLSSNASTVAELGTPAREFLARSAHISAPEALEARLQDSYSQSEAILTRALGPYTSKDDRA